jgi:hypothetical protein
MPLAVLMAAIMSEFLAGKRKLSPGVHTVTMKNGETRKVRVKKNGQWKFMKGGGSSSGKKKKTTKKTKKKTKKKSGSGGSSGGTSSGGRKVSKKKVFKITLMDLFRGAWHYANVTGHPPGPVLRAVIDDIRAGGGNTLDLVLNEVMMAWDNVTDQPVFVIGKAAGFEILYDWFKDMVPSRRIFKFGKFEVRTK